MQRRPRSDRLSSPYITAPPLFVHSSMESTRVVSTLEGTHEMILVNDGSRDNTWDCLVSLASERRTCKCST